MPGRLTLATGLRSSLVLGLVAACGGRTGLGVGLTGLSDASLAQPDSSTVDARTVDVVDDVPVTPSCTSGLVKITSTDVEPDEILIDGGFVYWHDRSGVSRAPKAGGTAQVLAQSAPLGWPELAAFALSTTNVYFAFGPTMIAAVSKTGGPVQPIPMPVPNFPAVATSPTMVYGWASSGTSPLLAMPLGGGPVQPVGTLPSASNKMVIDGARGFIASDGGVQYINLGSGAVTYLSGLGASDVAVDASAVYFSTIDVTNGTAIVQVPRNGGATSVILKRNGVYALALSQTDLYFTERLDMIVGKIIGKATSNVVQIAQFDFSTQPVAIALDDLCVYVTVAPNGAPGAIYAAPK